MKSEAGPRTWRTKERLKEKAAPASLRGDRPDKQGDVLPRLVSGDSRTSTSPHAPTRTSWAYREALSGFQVVPTTPCSLKAASPCGKGESGTRRHFKRDRIATTVITVQGSSFSILL